MPGLSGQDRVRMNSRPLDSSSLMSATIHRRLCPALPGKADLDVIWALPQIPLVGGVRVGTLRGGQLDLQKLKDRRPGAASPGRAAPGAGGVSRPSPRVTPGEYPLGYPPRRRFMITEITYRISTRTFRDHETTGDHDRPHTPTPPGPGTGLRASRGRRPARHRTARRKTRRAPGTPETPALQSL